MTHTDLTKIRHELEQAGRGVTLQVLGLLVAKGHVPQEVAFAASEGRAPIDFKELDGHLLAIDVKTVRAAQQRITGNV